MPMWRSDVSAAVRTFVRAPLVPVAAVVTLALGIGPTVAMVTVAYGALLQPLPYPEPERLVLPLVEDVASGDRVPLPPGVVADRVTSLPAFDRVSRIDVGGGLLVGGVEPAVVLGSAVDPAFYQLFGVPLARGRHPRAAGEAVISSRLWAQRFARREDIVGAVARYRDRPLTIVGVASTAYDFPYRNELWFVMPAAGPGPARMPDYALRLAPGVTLAQARAELAAIENEWRRDDPSLLQGRRLGLASAHEAETGHLRQPLLTLLAAAALIVVVACANVANLLLASAAGRRREVAIKRAMGASSWHIARAVLVESLLVGMTGVGAGVVLATWAVPAILSAAPDVITRQTAFRFGVPVLAVAAVLTLLITVAFGLAPALRLAGTPAAETLTPSAPTASGRQSRTMGLLLGMQTAAGMVLAVFTALFATSLVRTMEAVTAMPADRLVALRVDAAQTPDSAARVLEAVGAMVMGSSGRLVATSALPLLPTSARAVTLPGSHEAVPTPLRALSPGAFAAIRQRLVHGRDFSTADAAGAAPVAVVSETLARRVSGGTTDAAIGATLRIEAPDGPRSAAIVGVAADIRAGLTSRPGPEIYVPLAQAGGLTPATLYVVAPAGDAISVRADLVRRVRDIDAETPVGEAVRVDQMLRDRLVLPRFRTTLLSSFGVLALVLACAGVFAVALYTVARRTRELAVRVALGADRRALTRALAPVVVVPVGLGLIAGLAAAAWLAPLVRSMLFYEVSPTAPVAHATAAMVFALAALAATAVPLLRAWRLDPAATLRRE